MDENWRKLYASGEFNIRSVEASKVVQQLTKLLPADGQVLDLGCGEGRNALFLAGKGYNVDCVDLHDAHFLDNQPREIAGLINFTTGSIMEYRFPADRYVGVVMARLIQYISPEQLEPLLRNVANSLISHGKLALSYTASGGVLKE